MAGRLKFACVVLMCMALVGAPMVQAVVTCKEATGFIAPCRTYLQRGGLPSVECCREFGFVAAFKATTDRRTACNCFKPAVRDIDGYNDRNAVDLPAKCGAAFFYRLSIASDCASIP